MHIVLTDVLSCPACAEGQGLIARADRIADRRIEQGTLGCPVCRRQYPIRAGVAYLGGGDPAAGDVPKPGERGEAAGAEEAGAEEAGAEEAVRIAALLGLDRINGFVLLMGRACRHAAQVAALAENAEIVTGGPAGRVSGPDGGFSQLVVGPELPFLPGKLRGIWLADEFADTHLEPATVALQPSARLVLDPAPSDAEQRLPSGFRVVAQQSGTLLCERAG